MEIVQEATLHTIAEISATFVGFSLVGGILGSQAAVPRYRALSVRDVAELGLLGLIGSLLPSALHGFVASLDTTWRIASACLSVLWITTAYFGISRYYRGAGTPDAPRFLIVNPLLVAVGNLLLWWNVLAPSPSAGPRYVVTLILLLVVAGFAFIAAVFHGRHGPAA